MNDFSLENHLHSVQLRGAPADWKDRILSAAETATLDQCRQARRKMYQVIAWAALLVCWFSVGVSHWIGNREDVRLAVGVAPPDRNLQPPLMPTQAETEMLLATFFPEQIELIRP